MLFSIDDLTTPMTVDEVKTSIYEVFAAVGVTTTTWKPGAVVRTMVAGVAIVLAALSQLIALIARSGYLETASGQWLKLVAYYVYNVEAIEADFAAGEVTLVNGGGGVYAFEPGELTLKNTATGALYQNTALVELGALETVTITVRAVEAGSDSTALAGAIDALVTQALGVTCSNESAIVGSDAESDPEIRTRCYEKLGALSPNGPWDAYASAVRNAKRADGTRIGVTRVRVRKRVPSVGHVTTIVATATGGVTGTDTDVSTDLGALDDAIQRNAAPLAVTAHTVSATPAPIDVTYEAWAYTTAGLTQAQFEDLIELRLAELMASQPIGGHTIDPDPGKLFVTAILTAIKSVRSEIFRVDVATPAADVELTSTQVPVLGTVTCTAIHLVAPPEATT